ncbi:hypothetical protein OAM41_06435, partial [Gammaproteobacteria bacterium]|nr:hypothetical protein [Gammaproteobacteria bacterium]
MKNTLALVLMVFGIVGCASLSFETIGDTANGYGELRWKDGEYHKGYYSNSMRHGPGEMFVPLDCWACVGIDKGLSIGWFENNKFMGEIQDFNLNGISDGIGKFKFADGSSYQGNWRDGKFHGEGLYLNPAGRWYLGTFENGKVRGVSYIDGEIVLKDINSIVLNTSLEEQKAIEDRKKKADRERVEREQAAYAAARAEIKEVLKLSCYLNASSEPDSVPTTAEINITVYGSGIYEGNVLYDRKLAPPFSSGSRVGKFISYEFENITFSDKLITGNIYMNWVSQKKISINR